MGKSIQLGIIGLGLALPALPTVCSAQTISFHDAGNSYIQITGGFYNSLYYGQGVASDSGNNVWNGFGGNPGPGSTYFYGPANVNSGTNQPTVPNGNPGNPYAWYSDTANGVTATTTSTGTTLFSPTSYTAPNPGNATSRGMISTVTLTISGGYTADNSGLAGSGIKQGTPGFLLSTAALTTSTATFTLGSVPKGTYNLFLYGANNNGDRGAAFTVAAANGGRALGGFTSTTNANTGGANTNPAFILGTNYVEFLGVTPDASGNITGTWGAVTNPFSGLTGEGDFNGLQLQAVPEPGTWTAVLGAAVAGLFVRVFRRRKVLE